MACRRRKRKKKKDLKKTVLIFINILLFSVILIIIVTRFILPSMGIGEQSSPPQVNNTDNTDNIHPSEPTSVPQIGKLAFVFDDAGHNLYQLEEFLKLPIRMTIAVLPGLPYSTKAAQLTHKHGQEVILHLPMESINGNDPGPMAIVANQSKEEITRILEKSLLEVPFATAVNNHMGSLITQDPVKMDIILSFLAQKGLYFLDSKTIENSVARNESLAYNIKCLERDIFLDDVVDKVLIRQEIDKGMKMAVKNGYSILIGHIQNREVLEVMMEYIPRFTNGGYKTVRLSGLE
ncbi:MAG: divergent polysaccharide deacetylase family protein [Spirochaetales bacterium]|nr:divergent polysaccharide deacetylase family protein [Spirochaetales bacterium]